MRVALVMPARTVNWGGVQRFAHSLQAAMCRLHDVEPIWFHPDVGAPRTVRSFASSSLKGLRALFSSHHARRFDAVISTFHGPMKLLPRVPMLGFVHDLRLWGLHGAELADRNRRSMAARLLRAQLSTWDAALVPSAHVASDVTRLVPRLHVANVAEGLDHLDHHDRSATSTPRDTVLIIAGHAPHKRATLGVQIAERLCDELGCRATVVGSVAAASTHRSVEHHAQPSDEQLARLYSQARLAVAPTSYEGFGLAAGEAMWFGVPVVYGHDSMLGDLVQEGGRAAAPTVDAFFEAAFEVWRDQPRLTAIARGIARRYTWLGTARRITEQVERLAGASCAPTSEGG